MKAIRILLLGAGFFALLNLVRAQTDSPADLATMLEAIEQTTPTPFASLPNGGRAGTFWSAQHAPGTHAPWPPLPADMYGLDVWPLGDGIYLLNDTNLDYDGLAAAAAAAEEDSPTPMTRMSMMLSSLSTAYAYGNPVYLTNMAASFTNDGSITVNFDVRGGTNWVPYDTLTATNLTIPIGSWNWIGISYTSNNYTFYEQPASLGFYILAKPSKTMVVPWGDDSDGQCDLWPGITNAVQVTGGDEFSLALLNNGTVVGWGYDGVSSSDLVPTNLAGVTMIASGAQHNVALLTNGTVTVWGDDFWGELNVPAGLSNVTVISAQSIHSLALKTNGTVVAWGYGLDGEAGVPAALASVTAIAAGGRHNLAVSNGFVVAWGYNAQGQCNVPANLSNVWDVAAGWEHSVALKKDGTVVAWGDNTYGEANVPAGLSNVVTIAAGGDNETSSAYSLALKSDGTMVAWGDSDVVAPVEGMSHVIAIGAGVDHALAIRTGPRTPVITLEPADNYQMAGNTATFTARGVWLYGVAYQWQTNGVSMAGATNDTLVLTNVQAAQAGIYDVVVTDNGGMGSLTSSNATLYLVTPPVITSQSQPTNVVCIYGNNLSFNATATAPGMSDGFPLSYHWQFNGTNIPGITVNDYGFPVIDDSSGTYTLVVSNAAGSATASWQVTVTNVINVTNDLLLIYNTNSPDSTAVFNYYLANRPMVGGANVLGVGCYSNETFLPSEFTNSFIPQIQNWLAANPTKRPQYVILFNQIPSRVNITNTFDDSYPPDVQPSVQYQIYSGVCSPSWHPFVTSLNMNGFGNTSNCIGYINKLERFGTNYSPGKLVISASAGEYENTNYVLDNVRISLYNDSQSYIISNGIIPMVQSGIPTASILYTNGLESGERIPSLTNVVNVAGYISWGIYNFMDGSYPINGMVQWTGNSGWWLIETLESYNGQWTPGQGNIVWWYSANAFGGTNYSNTPIGAVSHTDEPYPQNVNDPGIYFGVWARGENFAICAWNSRRTPNFQAVGDPFVTR